ncbi:MAG: TlyA family rRNA (cytidine-2'-O)-methyltransferase [Deltaproteobacteria bacterium]|nr:MAG: TlyA family rRNA (cytidine-2'-O)-methyltransferase [Deltaproteobacteria bacterium]
MKKRLDELLVLKGLAADLKKAQALILSGVIIVEEQRVDKAGALFPSSVAIRKKESCPYVSRGGLKLAAGLKHYQLEVGGLICADIGASSGGFTDCLLQNGAAKVYAIDVAYGQLDWKIRQDERVVVMERFNARNIKAGDLADKLDLIVADLSFISLTAILPPLFQVFASHEKISFLALIKPQFELAKNEVGKGGVVGSEKLRQRAVDKIGEFCRQNHLRMHQPIPSPILGAKGNKEYLARIVGQG